MFHRPGRRLALAALFILNCAAVVAFPSHAADAKADAKAESKAESKADAKSEGDPDALRERLAERLKDDVSTLKLTVPAAKAKDEPKARRAAAATVKTAAATPSTAAAAAAARAKADAAWSYTGDGAPEHWASLDPEFRQCASGTRQSPIDLRDTVKVDQEQIQFEYKSSHFSVIDNGHTVQVNVGPGNFIRIMGRRYELLQFHFHRPSEERINGRQYDMVAHLVHKDADGRLAVVAVLLERGHDQSLIQTVWNHLPLEQGQTYEAPVQIDLAQLLPTDRAYFSYMGSLTRPPCTEGVLWMVFRQPVQVGPQQISVFSRLYPMNARPLQAQSGRLIKESN